MNQEARRILTTLYTCFNNCLQVSVHACGGACFGERAASTGLPLRVRADIIGHARINMYVNLSRAWLVADYFATHP